MIFINRVYYYVDGMVPTNSWEIVKNFEIFFAPLAINITQNFYDFMIEFFISKESDSSGQNTFIQKNLMETMKSQVGDIHSPDA